MAVTKAPVRQQSYLTEYDKLLAEHLRKMSGGIGAQAIAQESALGFPVGTMTAKVLGGVLAGAADRRAENRIKQSNAAQIALLKDAQEYSDPLPLDFQAGKYTDSQGNFVENLAPVERGVRETRDEYMARMLREQNQGGATYPSSDIELEAMGEKVRSSPFLDSDQTYKLGMNRPYTPRENPLGTFGGEALYPQGIRQKNVMQENITPYVEPERELLLPQETVQGITVEGTSEKPNWFDRIFKGEVGPATAKNQDELAILAGYDPLEYRIYQNQINANLKPKEKISKVPSRVNVRLENGEVVEKNMQIKTLEDANGSVTTMYETYNPENNTWESLKPNEEILNGISNKDLKLSPKNYLYLGKENVVYKNNNGIETILKPEAVLLLDKNNPNIDKELIEYMDRNPDLFQQVAATSGSGSGTEYFKANILVDKNNPAKKTGFLTQEKSTDGQPKYIITNANGRSFNNIDNPEEFKSYMLNNVPLSVSEITQNMKTYLPSSKYMQTSLDKLIKTERELKQIDQYVYSIDSSPRGASKLASDFKSYITRVATKNKLTEGAVYSALAKGQLQGLLGANRVEVVGPGVMTEFDAQRVIAYLGGDVSMLQNVEAVKKAMDNLLAFKNAQYFSDLDIYNNTQNLLPDPAKKIYKPKIAIKLNNSDWFAFSEQPQLTRYDIKNAKPGGDVYQILNDILESGDVDFKTLNAWQREAVIELLSK
jgi:hypothetical protein